MEKQSETTMTPKDTQLYSLKDYVEDLGPEMQSRIEEAAQRWQVAFRIADMRDTLKQTQGDVAKVLGISQPAVSKLERQPDMKLSTMASYVEALGGHLEISARFGDTEFHLISEDHP